MRQAELGIPEHDLVADPVLNLQDVYDQVHNDRSGRPCSRRLTGNVKEQPCWSVSFDIPKERDCKEYYYRAASGKMEMCSKWSMTAHRCGHSNTGCPEGSAGAIVCGVGDKTAMEAGFKNFDAYIEQAPDKNFE